jgi:hypothetical protein
MNDTLCLIHSPGSERLLRFIDDFDRGDGCVVRDRLKRQVEFSFRGRLLVTERFGQRMLAAGFLEDVEVVE